MDQKQMVEIIGIIASFLIFASMLAKTTTYKGTMFMRIFNTFGSLIFVIYGIFLPAFATIFMNSLIIIINLFYIVKEYKEHKKNAKNI